MKINAVLSNVEGYQFPIAIRPNTSDVYTANAIFGSGDYRLERSWLPIFTEDKFKPRFIIDGGANVGYASVFFANRYPNCEKIIAIEPELENFELLKYNTQYYPQIQPIRAALWNREVDLSVALGSLHKTNDSFMTTEVELDAPPPRKFNSRNNNRKNFS